MINKKGIIILFCLSFLLSGCKSYDSKLEDCDIFINRTDCKYEWCVEQQSLGTTVGEKSEINYLNCVIQKNNCGGVKE